MGDVGALGDALELIASSSSALRDTVAETVQVLEVADE